ncbi:SMC family ATPase, partial [Paenibacillus sp. IB182496]
AAAGAQLAAEQAREQARSDAAFQLRPLLELAPSVQELGRRRREEAGLAEAERAGERRLQEATAHLETQRSAKQAAQRHVAELEAASSGWTDKEGELQRLRARYKLLKQLAELERAAAEHGRYERELALELGRVREEHDRMEAAWLERQAGALALHLHDGQPCPVCGSTAHPQPAAGGGDAPSRESLQQLRERLLQAEGELHAVRAQASASAATIASRAEEMAELGVEPARMTEQLQRAEQDGQTLRAEADRLKALAEQLAEGRRRLQQLDEAIDGALRERERLAAAHQQALLARSALRSQLESELERIPEELREPEQLERRVAQQRTLEGELASAWRAAQERHSAAQTRLASARTAAAQLEQQAAEAEQAALQSGERLVLELERAGFASRTAYLQARLGEPERSELATRLSRYETALAAALQRRSELEQGLDGRERPDVPALQQQLDERRLAAERTAADCREAERQAESAQRLAAAIRTVQREAAQLEAELAQVLDLYEVMKGDNALKLSFERYILIEYLEQILQAANLRLDKLSSGQFRLQRSGRLEQRGRQSGLGLDVYDGYTGQHRDVKTLSGGEKFNASLSLALGMADMIQAHRGGIAIEMMLIDEGFGSLDEEALGKAVNALVELQRAGRMIGVISHVEELKQVFPAVLEVSKTREGHSRTRIVLQ